jgi:hypothetical protein
MTTHYIAFRKRPNIRLEMAVTGVTRTEARRIANEEIGQLRGYQFQGWN